MKFLLFLMLICTAVSHADIADPILKNYEKKLYRLPLIQQEHFAIRMYRITQKKQYLKPIIAYVHFLSHEYRSLSFCFDKPEQLLKKSNILLKNTNSKPLPKYKIRLRQIAEYGDLFFYLYLLEVSNKIFSYHMENSALFPQTRTVIAELKKQSPRIEAFILRPENIKIYAAQLINYVYYLHDLGIVDLRQAYTKQFQQTFPNAADSRLSDLEYEEKLYGLTHFVTAASHYYQNRVDEENFHWISDYFEHNIVKIIKRSENDLIAEVGVCLMLLNKQNSEAVEKIKQHLSAAYNTKYKMIPTVSNSVDFAYGEHRNILTIMLFKWPAELHEGPFF